MQRFVWLELHSVYSLMEGTIFISRLVEIAARWGYRYLSLTDTNGFYGLVRFLKESREAGIQPVIGTKLKYKKFEAILIAENLMGYSQISKILTGMHTKNDFDPLTHILEDGENSGYIVITSDKKLLESGFNNIYAEVNVLKKDYGIVYFEAKRRGIKPVLIYPVYFEKPEDYHTHRLLRAIHLNKKLSALTEQETSKPESFLREDRFILKNYGFMEDAIENTVEIAERASFDFPLGSPIMPVIHGEDSFNGFKRLKELCYKNIPHRYIKITHRITERLEKELSVIKEKGFADYFLIVHDIAKRSTYTCGRGSAAASLVSYLLFITHVDPIKHNLFFERFLNRDRTDPPDIDLDFPWDERDSILAYIFRKYGHQKTAMVSNHISFEARSSIREVAKVYGIPEKEIKEVTRHIRHYYNRTSDDFLSFSENRNPPESIKRIVKDAVAIYGRPRFLSVHPGGVIITPADISSYVPVQKSQKGLPIIQFEKDQAEDFGLVKIDILGNRSLAVIRDTLALIKKHYGVDIQYSHLNPLDDPKTILALAKGETIGVFYVESPAMRQLQKKTGRGDYEHLVIHSSIIRPAANNYINEYIKRLKGKPYTPILPQMDNILKETYGIMCYQEDITKIAVEIAGFSLKEGQELRKVVSNKNRAKRKAELKEKFYSNMLKRGIEREKIDSIWNMIESFSGYSFCKAHSASYALVSFKACYLKVHYPAEFMGAVLKNQGGYYSALAYISEARRMGLKVELPEINESTYFHFGKGKKVQLGFMLLKNLSYKLANSIEIERKKRGKFTGLKDFISRLRPSLKDLLILIRAGCFRNLENHNIPEQIFIANKIYGKSYRGDKTEEGSLFDLSPCTEEINPPSLKPLSLPQRIKTEMELFGFIVSMHPMEYFRRYIREDVIKGRDIPGYIGKKIKTAGILITAKTVLTRDKNLMQFVSFEDETAIFETVLFPRVYSRFSALLEEHQPYIIEGTVISEFGVTSVQIESIKKVPIGHRSPEVQHSKACKNSSPHRSAGENSNDLVYMERQKATMGSF